MRHPPFGWRLKKVFTSTWKTNHSHYVNPALVHHSRHCLSTNTDRFAQSYQWIYEIEGPSRILRGSQAKNYFLSIFALLLLTRAAKMWKAYSYKWMCKQLQAGFATSPPPTHWSTTIGKMEQKYKALHFWRFETGSGIFFSFFYQVSLFLKNLSSNTRTFFKMSSVISHKNNFYSHFRELFNVPKQAVHMW